MTGSPRYLNPKVSKGPFRPAVVFRALVLTITRDDEELVVIGQIVYHDIRIRGNNLLLWSQLCALLELEVAEGAGQCKIA